MKIDKTAEIPIRHRWQDYICCIGYSEYEEEFTLISSRYANPHKTETPNNEMDLYLRILKEPALRANMLEALTPELEGQISDLREKAISERGNSIGLWAGFVAMGIAGYILYKLTQLLAKYVGYDWAEMITYIPAVFAFLIIFPIQHIVQRWHARRYCIQHSHRFKNFKSKEGEFTWCSRCGFGLGASESANKNPAGEA